MTPEAERFNGWAAMLGFVAAVGAYVTTGQIIPGWFQKTVKLFFQQELISSLLDITPTFFTHVIFNFFFDI